MSVNAIKPGTLCYMSTSRGPCKGCRTLDGLVVTVTGAPVIGVYPITPSLICPEHFGGGPARSDKCPRQYLIPISDPDFRETDERDRRVSA